MCHFPKLSRAVISGQQSPISDGDTISAVALPVSAMISVGCSLCPDRLVSIWDICAAVSLPLSISVPFWHVNLEMGAVPHQGLVVIAQVVVGILLSQDR